MSTSETFRIPLPRQEAPAPTGAEAGRAGRAGRLVADFLRATRSLSCEDTADLAGVRAETIRKWRHRLPRWVKDTTSRRMHAYLGGTPPHAPDEGFRRVFRRVLRSTPSPADLG